jgi:hypothetical protein
MSDQWSVRGLLLAVGLSGLWSSVAQATDPLPATTSLVASAGAAAPTQSTFTITGPQDLVITLQDLQNPAALTSLSVAITQGGQLAAGYTLSSQTPTTTLSAANGTYTISVFGVPSASVGAGTFSVCVAPSSTPADCLLPGAPSLGGNVASFAGSISTQSAAENLALSTTTYTLVVPAPGGSYTFSYADLTFPVALSSSGALSPNPNLGLFSGGLPVNDVNGNPGLGFASGDSFNLSAGTYTLLVAALADSTVLAGSYAITVTGPAGSAPLLDVAVPVGELNQPSSVNNPAQQSLTLTVTDYAFPGALAQASAMLTTGGTKLLSTTSTGGPVTTTAPAGTLQLWNYAKAGATAGTYGVDVAAGNTDLFLGGYGVAESSSNYAYAFVTPALTANTAYQASAVDLQFPSILSALSFAVAHDGTVTTQTGGSSTIDFTPAASGAAVVLVAASTPSSGSVSGNGLFDVNVQTSGNSPQLVFDQTQSVSSTPGFFDTSTVSVGTAGNYNVTLTDLQFPAAFANLALAVTQGSQILGKIYGGGTFTFAATPGNYRLTFVATPQSSQQFGLYADSMTYAAPTVSLTSSAASAAAGSSITLNWTTTNATSCTASGGSFTGSVTPGTGSQSVTLSATTTYTLKCTGAAGSASGSVMVTATSSSSSSSSSSGGGGAFGAGELVLWGLATAAAVCRRWRGSRPTRRAT